MRRTALIALALASALLSGCSPVPAGCMGGDDGSCVPPSPCKKLSGFTCADSSLEVRILSSGSERPRGLDALAATGDLFLRNGAVTIVLDALDSPHALAPSGGNVLDMVARTPGAGDELNQVLHVAGILPEDTVRYEEIEILDHSPEYVGAVLRGRLDGRAADVVTRYELRPCEPGLRVRTELFYRGEDPQAFFLADGFWWGNREVTPFVPIKGEGFLLPELELLELGDSIRETPFLAAGGHSDPGGSYALVPCGRKTLHTFNSTTVSAAGLPRTLVMPAKDGYWSAPELESKLVALRKSGPEEADSVLVAIDPAWPYMIFKKILYTANKSGYVRVQFAVRKEGSDLVQRLPLRKGGVGSRGVAIRIADGKEPVLGSLDPATIDDVMKQHLPEIRYCYERELAKDADLGGNLVMNFTIGAEGLVTSARTKSSTLAHEGVKGCVRARLLKLRFPKPEGGGVVNVSYPFPFAKSDRRLNDGSHSPD